MTILNLIKLPVRTVVRFLSEKTTLFKKINDFRYSHGRFPNFIKPKNFTERLFIKMALDRDPKLTLFADKYLVRGYVEKVCGAEILTQIYATISKANQLRALKLPQKFVMKANHLSGSIKIVHDFDRESIEELVQLADDWLKRNYYDNWSEWAYKNIKPLIMFEELLDFNNETPDDYKIYCFNGSPKLIQVDRGRFVDHKRNFYDLTLALLPVKLSFKNFEEKLIPPPNFNQMIDIASKLSKGVDFVRVDLYNINGRIVFGELTNYPGAGLERFAPDIWDERIGRFWV